MEWIGVLTFDKEYTEHSSVVTVALLDDVVKEKVGQYA